MENIVLTIGGLLKSFGWSDLFFFSITLTMILLLIYILYLIRLDESKDDIENMLLSNLEKKDLSNKKETGKPLSAIVDKLETEYKPKPIDLSDYEKEQENTAIISYDELVSRSSNNIYYDDEYDSGFDDVLIQKVDNKESKTQELVDLPRAVMMSYESEEAFLSALKSLQKNLVR
ncbi:MAG TPA: hypothetical protein DCY94_05500 [Firmicutes bacterium]|nr:hypothetical protein [Bacillota bacterium]